MLVKGCPVLSGDSLGGQPGHKGHSRDLYPIEECSEVIDHHPEECASCGETLSGSDTNPYRHQIVEIPPITPIVIEHRLHQLTCTLCGATTSLVTFFEIALTRCTQAAQNLLGENFGGILNSDRHGAYNWIDLERRQLCWAHLRREFIKISERPGVSAQLGTALVKQQEKLFELW